LLRKTARSPKKCGPRSVLEGVLDLEGAEALVHGLLDDSLLPHVVVVDQDPIHSRSGAGHLLQDIMEMLPPGHPLQEDLTGGEHETDPLCHPEDLHLHHIEGQEKSSLV